MLSVCGYLRSEWFRGIFLLYWKPFRWRSGGSEWSLADPCTSLAPPVCPRRAAGTADPKVSHWGWCTLHLDETSWKHNSYSDKREDFIFNYWQILNSIIQFCFKYIQYLGCRVFYPFFSNTALVQLINYQIIKSLLNK